jgi:hypothetical protein
LDVKVSTTDKGSQLRRAHPAEKLDHATTRDIDAIEQVAIRRQELEFLPIRLVRAVGVGKPPTPVKKMKRAIGVNNTGDPAVKLSIHPVIDKVLDQLYGFWLRQLGEQRSVESQGVHRYLERHLIERRFEGGNL